MGTDKQIIIVGTGYCKSLDDYYSTPYYNYDMPAYVIRRDGTLESTPSGCGHTIAIENAGPVINCMGLWVPAQRGRDGKYSPIEGAEPVRVPYEFCSCRPYHGCMHYEYITTKQLEKLREVIVRWLSEFSISYPYDNQLGTICPRARAGKSGIYFASSFDEERSDIHPQKELIDIIKAYSA